LPLALRSWLWTSRVAAHEGKRRLIRERSRNLGLTPHGKTRQQQAAWYVTTESAKVSVSRVVSSEQSELELLQDRAASTSVSSCLLVTPCVVLRHTRYTLTASQEVFS